MPYYKVRLTFIQISHMILFEIIHKDSLEYSTL